MPSCVGHVLNQMQEMRHSTMVQARKAKRANDEEGIKKMLRYAFHFHGLVMACRAMLKKNGNNRDGYFSHEWTKDIREEYKLRSDDIIWKRYDRARAVRHGSKS